MLCEMNGKIASVVLLATMENIFIDVFRFKSFGNNVFVGMLTVCDLNYLYFWFEELSDF